MLQKTQAYVIADEILKQARHASLEKHTTAFSSVALLYRCRELRALPRWMQTEVVRHATQSVAQSPIFILVVLAWLLVIGALWMYGTELAGKSAFTGPLIVASWGVPLFLRGALVRREVRLIATQLEPFRADFPSFIG
jgi:hypothetical protein